MLLQRDRLAEAGADSLDSPNWLTHCLRDFDANASPSNLNGNSHDLVRGFYRLNACCVDGRETATDWEQTQKQGLVTDAVISLLVMSLLLGVLETQ